MANILVLGGGFAGVVAAESLAQRLGPEHRITLVSRHREFTFFPSLVRLAFGRLKLEDVFFDLVHAMRSQRVALTQAEVTGYDPDKRYVVVPRGRFERRIAVHCHAADQIADPAAVIIGRTGHLASCRSRAYATRNI